MRMSAGSRADRPQAVDEVADRALVHPRHAAQRVVAALQGQRRGERADRGAGIAHEEIGLPGRESSGATLHPVVVARRAGLRLARPAHAESAQRLEHHARVVGIEELAHPGLAAGQGREQQDPVGDALGAGQLERAFGPRQRAERDRGGGGGHGKVKSGRSVLSPDSGTIGP
jgi:hypothetical protein